MPIPQRWRFVWLPPMRDPNGCLTAYLATNRPVPETFRFWQPGHGGTEPVGDGKQGGLLRRRVPAAKAAVTWSLRALVREPNELRLHASACCQAGALRRMPAFARTVL